MFSYLKEGLPLATKCHNNAPLLPPAGDILKLINAIVCKFEDIFYL